MIIYQFEIEHQGKIERYKIDRTYKSKGCKSNYQQVETWELICESNNRTVITCYGRGIETKIKRSLTQLKQKADRFTVLQDFD